MKRQKLLILFGGICLALMLTVLPLMTACPVPPPEVKTLKIGVISTLTGPGSETEVLCTNGALLAEDWINDRGGITINGQKYLIELVVEDQKSTAEGAVAAATKLVEDHKVKFITGGIVPFMVIAAGTVTEPAGVLRSVWYNTGVPPEMNPETPYTFRANTGGIDTIPEVYKYLVETYPEEKTVAIVAPDDAAAPISFDVTKKAAEALGLTVVAMETYPWGTEDYYPLLTKVLASKPDAIGNTAGFPMMVGGVMKAARELGFTGPVFCPTQPDITVIRDIVGKDLATDWFNTSIVVDSPEMTPMIKEIKQMSLDRYGQFTQDFLIGWDGVWCLVQAIEEAQSLDPSEVAKAWEEMGRIETAYGTAKMGGLETYGVNHVVVKPFAISRIMNGEVEHVKWVLPEIP